MRENLQTGLSRGRRSRNKVSVGEPAEGSFQQQTTQKLSYTEFLTLFSKELTGALRYSGAVFNVALSAFLLNRVAASALFFFLFKPTSGFGYQRDECKTHQTKYTFQRWTSWFSQR